MIKHKRFSDFSKEEVWLSEMSQNGFAFVSAYSFGNYEFIKAEPCKNNYRIDYRTFRSQRDFIDYCTLFEDSGWKHIWGSKNSGRQYFIRLREDADPDIFSDDASKAERYKRLSCMWSSLLVIYFALFSSLLSTEAIQGNAFTNPKALYYTPGLWNMTGAEFWQHFLFETPFAVLRGYSWLIFLFIILYFFFKTIKTYNMYRQNSKKM